jgi:hypothetical protein
MAIDRKRPKRMRISSRTLERKLEWAMDDGNEAHIDTLSKALDATFTDRLQYLIKLADPEELMNEIRRIVGLQDHWRKVVEARQQQQQPAQYERPVFEEEQVSG